MRIVAGDFRGRAIAAPDGTDTRPTTDRVREALFSSLFSLRGGFEGACVLDAFAGSGALGLEALSRGARSCMFYERDRKAASVLRRNIAACGLDARHAEVVQRDVLKTPPAPPSGPFDLVFLDPPYAFEPDQVVRFVAGLRDSGMLAADAMIVYEHALASRDAVSEALGQVGFEALASKKYGKTGVTLFGGL